ncbi:EcsC family protein [Pedobacter hartonius]|nr:EcsC family protein [Pedobacter hartonius]
MQLQFWQLKMLKKPSFTDRVSKNVQDKINMVIPEKVHDVITLTIENMIKAVLFGAKYTTSKSPDQTASLQLRESHVKKQISFYQKTASLEGAVTGAGGILLGLADFPLLLSIKLKMVFDIASLYGFDVKDYKERLYLLYLFQLAFSSQHHRNDVYQIVSGWQGYSNSLPDDVTAFDWRKFQQEYRDYIDLSKMAQLLPVIGAAVGAIANYKLIAQLGDTAMNGYRMRRLSQLKILKG